MTLKLASWILRIAVFGEFLGHGVLALKGNPVWVGWLNTLFGIDKGFAAQLLYLIGVMNVIVAFIIIFRPISLVLLWAAFWGIATAFVSLLAGDSIWDFISQWVNWGAPSALFLIKAWFKHFRE